MSNSEHLQELSFDVADWPPFNISDLLAGDTLEAQSDQASTESPAVIDVETTLDVISSCQSQPHNGQGTLPLLQLATGARKMLTIHTRQSAFITLLNGS
jgi:hypothetical protein